MNIFKNIFRKQQSPARRPSPLLLEMEAVNENLLAIQALLAAQRPAGGSSPAHQQPQPDTSGFEPFEPFDNSGEESTQ